MKRLIMLGAVPLLTVGCVPVIPLPISIVTSSLSGISLLTTGKSTTDHVISAANKQDCAMHRVALGDEMCRNYASGEYRPDTRYTGHFPGDRDTVPQSAEVPEVWGDAVDKNTAELPETDKTGKDGKQPDAILVSSLAAPMRVPADVALDVSGLQPASAVPSDVRLGGWGRPVTPIAVESAELPPLPMTRPSATPAISQNPDLHYLSLGSFRVSDRADHLMRRYAGLSPTVMTVVVGGETWKRVAVGPMEKSAVEKLRRAHPRIDGHETWTFAR